MELRNLPLGKFFMNLLRENAGMWFTEFAVIGEIVVSLYFPLLLAALLIN
ncbi:hypothetical protein [Variovorax sp. Root411]|nr:hypothetical protein [Variovorax sp. Root411]